MKDPNQVKTCPLCSGTGRDPKDHSKPCPVCHGRGRVNSTFER